MLYARILPACLWPSCSRATSTSPLTPARVPLQTSSRLPPTSLRLSCRHASAVSANHGPQHALHTVRGHGHVGGSPCTLQSAKIGDTSIAWAAPSCSSRSPWSICDGCTSWRSCRLMRRVVLARLPSWVITGWLQIAAGLAGGEYYSLDQNMASRGCRLLFIVTIEGRAHS